MVRSNISKAAVDLEEARKGVPRKILDIANPLVVLALARRKMVVTRYVLAPFPARTTS